MAFLEYNFILWHYFHIEIRDLKFIANRVMRKNISLFLLTLILRRVDDLYYNKVQKLH